MSYLVDQILKQKDIPAYLASRGIYPDVDLGAQLKYCCPLPEHQDDSPSFYVHLPEDKPQWYFCFGCKESGNIFRLKMIMEGLTWRDAFRALSDGVEVDADDQMAYTVRKLTEKKELTIDPEVINLMASRDIYTLMRRINFEEPYRSKCERALALLDEALNRMDLQRAVEIYDLMPEYLQKLGREYEEQKEYAISETVAAYRQIK